MPRKNKIEEAALEAIAKGELASGGGFSDNPPERSPTESSPEGWTPDLNPSQRPVWDDPTDNVLVYGERGSGKTIGCGHKAIRHCYENDDAFALLIAPSIFTGKEGIWHDLDTLILPLWHEGIGLDFSEAKQDPDTKDRHRWIGNVYGGWSKMVLKSIPHANYVAARIKGPAPSFVYVDELTHCEGREYWSLPAQGLGRRRGIQGPQQFVASCNPEGPSHWVYKVWWDEAVDHETGIRDPRFSIHHIPISENIHRLPPGYRERLESILKDPIERRRLLLGEWVDRPTGAAIFKDYFDTNLHVKGDAIAGIGLRPVKGFPIVCSYDPGPVNFSVHFMQLIFLKQEARYVWIVFDELNLVGKPTPYASVTKQVLKKMDFWCQKIGTQFQFEHISDEAAFNHRRSNGSYDATEIRNLSNGRIRMKPCPKGKESVPARVKVLIDLLQSDSIYISAICTKTIDMFLNLTSETMKNDKYDEFAGFRPKRSIYLHPFDSISYAPFYYQMHGALHTLRMSKVETRCYLAGSGSSS